MKVHHLSCGTMCPRLGRLLVNAAGRMVCHCLLIETERSGLVLVDTGFGSLDVAEPRRMLKPWFRLFGRPRLSTEITAIDQIRRLGHDPRDVRHVIPTHLDMDHAGGLVDFPWASVHLLAAEHRAAMRRTTLLEKERYQPPRWRHGPRWVLHRPGEGEAWMGFDCVRDLPGLDEEILLVPLPGHTRGHAGVAVRRGDGRWLLHAGDAYFFSEEIHGAKRRCSPGLSLFQTAAEMDRYERMRNQRRLRALVRERGDAVNVFCAHDPFDLERCQAEARALEG